MTKKYAVSEAKEKTRMTGIKHTAIETRQFILNKFMDGYKSESCYKNNWTIVVL